MLKLKIHRQTHIHPAEREKSWGAERGNAVGYGNGKTKSYSKQKKEKKDKRK